jgi:preprotein translocase subunit YajC
VHTSTSAGTSPVVLIVGYALLLAVFWFVFIRPASQQRRRHQEMLKTVKRGDRVVTQGGLHGVVAEVKDDLVVLRVAPKVDVTIDKSAIQRVHRLKKDEEGAPAGDS